MSRSSAEDAPEAAGLAQLVDALPVGLLVVGPESQIRSLNPAAANLLGLEPDAVLGRTCSEVLRCSFCAAACATCEAREDGIVRKGFPTEIRRGDGARCSVLLDAVPLGGGDVAVVLRDVSPGERLRRALQERWVFHGLVCASTAMKDVVDRIRDVAPFDSTVLVLGESGTGKELVARAVHAESHRAGQPFVAVHCAAYSENLLESELFGHARGSFTGAQRDRKGRFEIANGGTVFLDEIAEISPKIQVKLLRVLQQREIERVGENRPRPVDLRIIAATNRDLRRAVAQGSFRDDLFYRLNVFTLELPPLSERADDVPALAEHFLQSLAERTGKDVRGFAPDVMEAFLQHAWPGNVRELENVVESAVVRARGREITAADLPEGFRAETRPGLGPDERIRAALEKTAGCVTRAARLLGIHRTTLWRQMGQHGIRREDYLVG